MGCWGMGLTQSDDFCDVYDSFMEEYDAGKEVAQISAGILAQYCEEMDDSYGALHDVYFALAKAEWMCGAQSDEILNKVKVIIESGANIDFYRELEATESDLKIRRKNLDKFWLNLQTPRRNPRKRKPRDKAADLEKGTIFWYRSKGSVYGALVLEKLNQKDYLVVLTEALKEEPKLIEQILDVPVYTAAWFAGLLPSKRIHCIGQVSVEGNYNGRAGMYCTDTLYYCENCGYGPQWEHTARNLRFEALRVRDMLIAENVSDDVLRSEHLRRAVKEIEEFHDAFRKKLNEGH